MLLSQWKRTFETLSVAAVGGLTSLGACVGSAHRAGGADLLRHGSTYFVMDRGMRIIAKYEGYPGDSALSFSISNALAASDE